MSCLFLVLPSSAKLLLYFGEFKSLELCFYFYFMCFIILVCCVCMYIMYVYSCLLVEPCCVVSLPVSCMFACASCKHSPTLPQSQTPPMLATKRCRWWVCPVLETTAGQDGCCLHRVTPYPAPSSRCMSGPFTWCRCKYSCVFQSSLSRVLFFEVVFWVLCFS